MASKKGNASTGRTVLNLEERVNVIKENDRGLSERRLAERFKCGKTQINTILKNKNVILAEWEDNVNRCVKRKRQEKFAEINVMLFNWFKCACSKMLPVSGPILN